MPVPFLPVDVVVTILENLRGDTATLRACGMACHDWLGAARSSLFRFLYFTANLTQRGITSAQDVSASSSALLGKLRDFAAFLDKNPEIGSMVREFILRERHTWNSDSAPPVDMHVLLEVFAKMPNLHAVTFVGVWCAFSPSEAGVCASVGSITIDNLTQRFPVAPNYPWRLVTCFPNVKDVRIRGCVPLIAPGQDGRLHATEPNVLQLQSLTVSRSWPLAHWCNFHETSLRSLRTLKLAASGPGWAVGDIPAVRRILQCAGEQVQHLHLGLSEAPDHR